MKTIDDLIADFEDYKKILLNYEGKANSTYLRGALNTINDCITAAKELKVNMEKANENN